MEDKIFTIDEKSILLRYSSHLREQAQYLESLIIEMSQQGILIEDGVKIQFGWSFLIFREYECNNLIICEPDFFKNPFFDEKQSIDFTIEIQEVQNSFAQRCRIEPVFTLFQDKIILAKGCLNEEKLFMERINPDSEQGDSGWFINRLDHSDEEPELEAIYAFQLLVLRPELFPVLILPPGFMVLINNKVVEKVINHNNEVITL